MSIYFSGGTKQCQIRDKSAASVAATLPAVPPCKKSRSTTRPARTSPPASKHSVTPHRVAVIHLLSGAGEPVCVVDIERHLPLSQSTVSYHLKTLLKAGVIKREPRGKWSYYTVQPDRLAELTDALERYTRRLTTTSA